MNDSLPPKPVAPLPSDCCGTGCCPCVHDIYEQDMKRWKKLCESLQNCGISDELKEKSIYPDRWTEFSIIKIETVTPTCFKYVFKLKENECLGLDIGQHVMIKQTKEDRTISRQYTPVSDIRQKGSFEIIIKIYPKGKITQIIKDWKVGDMVPLRGPFGSFSYTANSYKHVIMLAAGTGIAPLYQVLRGIAENEEDETFITLLYGSKCFSEILLRNELLSLCQYWNVNVRHYLSQEDNLTQKKYNENIIGNKLSKTDVCQELKKGLVTATLVLICGTKSFDKDMINASLNADVPEENIFKF
ncbi:NADH-cytochrome b5 reductase-like [Palaemon carinicauda]|uniref:NADH-cytochrome b5 reductase-like n=1 Tax=Palaemon carinicauda TaxID=392227 RepID=UPI0035B64585